MKGAALVIALSTAGMTACAAANLNMSRSERPDDQLNRGVRALQAQDYTAARKLLEPLYMERFQEPVGQRAALAIVSAELDSRNPERHLWQAADISARLLSVPNMEPWMVPVAETYYLLAQELGAQEERLAAVDAALAEAERKAMPQSTRETVPAQINRLKGERDVAKRGLDSLTVVLAARDKELRDTKAELERIKKTIKK